MKAKKRNILKTMSSLFLCVLLFSLTVGAQDDIIDFESDRWKIAGGKVITFMERKALVGSAYLKDVVFENGVIEVDIAVRGTRSYPGINFRIKSFDNYEHFYIRPHRAGLYPDALQYAPRINGIGGWQLYNGPGFTAESPKLQPNKWIHVRLEVKGAQARVFLDDAEVPALVIDHLKHGAGKGMIGVSGPTDQSACFSNFKYKADNTLKFDPPPKVITPPGIFTDWQLSQTLKLSQVDVNHYPPKEELAKIKWKKVRPEATGLVDIAWHNKRTGREPDCVLAKTTIHAEKDKILKFIFGYSDSIILFLNGQIMFTGNSAYRLRDPSFLGIVGLFDTVHLPLKKGDNEIFMIIAEAFGGWGFIAQDGDTVFEYEGMKRIWESRKEYKMPESVIYDPKRSVLYVSNYDVYGTPGAQTISKISLNGNIEKADWITELTRPTGMTLYKDKLYVVERENLVEIDPGQGKVIRKFPFPEPRFPNDVTVDKSGNFYVTDSLKNVIFKLTDGKFTEWLRGGGRTRPNGIHFHNDKLIVGNNGDNTLISVDLSTKKVTTITNLGPGIIDGIRTDENGDLLVSHYEGKIYRVTMSGQVTRLLDTTVLPLKTADFEYIPAKKMFIIPTLENNKVFSYQLEK
jgi:sugar lactone lactonase YvrE